MIDVTALSICNCFVLNNLDFFFVTGYATRPSRITRTTRTNGKAISSVKGPIGRG